jgi:hypothetical protein
MTPRRNDPRRNDPRRNEPRRNERDEMTRDEMTGDEMTRDEMTGDEITRSPYSHTLLPYYYTNTTSFTYVFIAKQASMVVSTIILVLITLGFFLMSRLL